MEVAVEADQLSTFPGSGLDNLQDVSQVQHNRYGNILPNPQEPQSVPALAGPLRHLEVLNLPQLGQRSCFGVSPDSNVAAQVDTEVVSPFQREQQQNFENTMHPLVLRQSAGPTHTYLSRLDWYTFPQGLVLSNHPP